jgi:hypothetical protein
MRRTFLVAVEVPESVPPEQVAQDILESLIDTGYDTYSVKPWAEHSASTAQMPQPQMSPPPIF